MQKYEVTCLKSASWKVGELGFKPKSIQLPTLLSQELLLLP